MTQLLNAKPLYIYTNLAGPQIPSRVCTILGEQWRSFYLSRSAKHVDYFEKLHRYTDTHISYSYQEDKGIIII